MSRPVPARTAQQLRRAKQRRLATVAALLACIPLGLFVSFGLATLLFLLVLGVATFASGGPSDNGRTRASIFRDG